MVGVNSKVDKKLSITFLSTIKELAISLNLKNLIMKIFENCYLTWMVKYLTNFEVPSNVVKILSLSPKYNLSPSSNEISIKILLTDFESCFKLYYYI